MSGSRVELTRPQILAFRRDAGGLGERLPPGEGSLRRAAWAGLQDSMPRAALLSIHARVEGAEPSTWEDPSLVQLWYRTLTAAARCGLRASGPAAFSSAERSPGRGGARRR